MPRPHDARRRRAVETRRPRAIRPGPRVVEAREREAHVREYARLHRCSYAEASESIGE